MAGKFILKMPDFHVAFRDLLHAVYLRHGTHSFTSLQKEDVLRIFFALKNPTASAGFEPANFGFKCQHTTSRPPKPLKFILRIVKQLRKICRSEMPRIQSSSLPSWHS
jgi:hypothetical protein